MHRRRTAALTLTLFCAAAAPAAVPRNLRGNWALIGHCATQADRLVITATTAALGKAPAQPVIFNRNDGPHGESSLRWAQEGNVDNFVAGPDGTLIHNPEGYGMGQPETFRRCPP
jgi:hypothetical protein